MFDYTTLPSHYVFKPGYITNGTYTGPQTPQDISQRFRNATIDLPIDLTSGRVTLQGASTLAQTVQVSGGTLQLADNWSNTAGIQMSSGVVQLYSAGAASGDLDFTGGTLRVTYATTLTALTALDFGTPDRIEIGESPNGNYSGNLDLEGGILDLDDWSESQWAVRNNGRIRNGTIAGTHAGPTFSLSAGSVENVLLDDVKVDGGRLYNSVAEGIWATGTVYGGGTMRDSRLDGGLSGTFAIEGNLETHGILTGTIQFSVGSSLTGTGVLGGGLGRVIRDRFTFVDPQVTLPAEIELVSSTPYDSNTILDAPNTNLVVEGDIRVGYATTSNPSWTDSWTFQVTSLETRGNTTVMADGKLYVPEAMWTNRGNIQLTGGLLDFESLRIEAGGEFAGWGSMVGDVVVNGTLEATKPLQITGNLSLSTSATTRIELGSSALLPTIDVNGIAVLAGELQVDLTPAFSNQSLAVGNLFTLLSAESIRGFISAFETNHPLIDFSLIQTVDELLIEITRLPSIAGDLNFDDVVDELDFGIWRDSYGQTAAGDADLDGDTDGRDFLLLQRQYGMSAGELSDLHFVPEPTTAILLICAAGVCLMGRRIYGSARRRELGRLDGVDLYARSDFESLGRDAWDRATTAHGRGRRKHRSRYPYPRNARGTGPYKILILGEEVASINRK